MKTVYTLIERDGKTTVRHPASTTTRKREATALLAWYGKNYPWLTLSIEAHAA